MTKSVRKSTHFRYWWSLGVSVPLAGLGLFLSWGHPHPKTVQAASLTSATVRVGTITKQIALKGSVVSLQQVAVSYSGATTSVAKVNVSTGNAVTSGTVLATMANGSTLVSPLSGTVVAIDLNAGDLVPSSSSTTTSTAPNTSSNTNTSSGGFGHGFSRGGGTTTATPTQAIATALSPLSITVANISDVAISANISQLQVHDIAAGDAVSVVIPGEPGILYHGTVSEIAMTASDSGTSVSYPVNISLTVPKGDPIPLPGMSAQLEVNTQEAQGVTIPITAVSQTAHGQYTVKLASGRTQPISVGLTGVNRVIASSGLRAGEKILVPASSSIKKPQVTVEVLPSASPFGGSEQGVTLGD